MSEFPYIHEIVEHLSVERKKRLDNAIFGEIKEIIKDNSLDTVILLDETAIVNALKKQMPKKYIENCYPWAICPECGGSVNVSNVQEHIQNCETTYCEHCGQALDWSDTE